MTKAFSRSILVLAAIHAALPSIGHSALKQLSVQGDPEPYPRKEYYSSRGQAHHRFCNVLGDCEGHERDEFEIGTAEKKRVRSRFGYSETTGSAAASAATPGLKHLKV